MSAETQGAETPSDMLGRTKVFVRDVVRDVFGQEPEDDAVEDIARRILATWPWPAAARPAETPEGR